MLSYNLDTAVFPLAFGEGLLLESSDNPYLSILYKHTCYGLWQLTPCFHIEVADLGVSGALS